MSVTAYRIATDARTYPADDLSGTGAKQTGGRWNEPGAAMVYTSGTCSLACLETLVHLDAGALPLNRILIAVAIPDEVWAVREEQTALSLPIGWDVEPASLTSIRFGTDWLRRVRTPILVVPSAIVPEESNILVNPLHPASPAIVATRLRRWTYDPRMARPSGPP